MVKITDNTQRDTFFAFSNEIANSCDALNISSKEVIRSCETPAHLTTAEKLLKQFKDKWTKIRHLTVEFNDDFMELLFFVILGFAAYHLVFDKILQIHH